MTVSIWKFPVLAFALCAATSCTANPTEPSVIASTTKIPVIAVTIQPPVIAETIDPADIKAFPNLASANPTATTKASLITIMSTANTKNAIAPFDQRILAAHNRERLGLGLRPLSWNSALAEMAQHWANYLAATDQFEHAPENRLAPEGENLWAGTKGYYSPEAQVGAWIHEKRFFKRGVFPNNSITGRVEDVGHYTQVVWRATSEVGCGEASDTREDILVCRYADAGNYRGEQPF